MRFTTWFNTAQITPLLSQRRRAKRGLQGAVAKRAAELKHDSSEVYPATILQAAPCLPAAGDRNVALFHLAIVPDRVVLLSPILVDSAVPHPLECTFFTDGARRNRGA